MTPTSINWNNVNEFVDVIFTLTIEIHLKKVKKTRKNAFGVENKLKRKEIFTSEHFIMIVEE